MSWTEPLPEWNASGTEPPQGKKDDGWQSEEKPPAGWFNWLFSRIYECLAEVRSVIDGLFHASTGHKHTGAAGDAPKVTHSDLASIGATDHHSNANDPGAGEKSALAGTSGTPGAGNKYVTNEDSRNTNARAPTAHTLGGSAHSADTLANFNAKISDANLDAAGSARPPASHANEAHSTEMATAGSVTAKFHASTGHKHTGTAGDAPQVAKANVGLGNVDNVQQAPLRLAINARTSSYILALSDGDGKLVTMDSSSAHTIMVPPNSSVAFPIGTQILIQRLGTGDVTLVAGSGVTLQSADGALKLRVQYGMVGLVKRLTDTWGVGGDVVT